MNKALASISALLLSVAILLTGNGMQGLLIPVRAGIETFSTVAIGVLGTSYYVGFALGCLFGAETVKKVGHIRAYLAMIAIASAAPLAHVLVFMPFAWAALRLFSGFCFAVMFIVIESWINERATADNRGQILALYLIINLSFATVGQMALPLFDPGGFDPFIVASILVSLAAVPVALTNAAVPAPVAKVEVQVRAAFEASPVGVVGCFVVGLTIGSFVAVGPVYAQLLGLNIAGIALFMSAAVVGGALGQWPLGRLSDLVDRRLIVAGTSALAVVCCILLGRISGDDANLLLLAAAAFGAVSYPLYTLAIADANDHVPAAETVVLSSTLMLTWAAGAAIGPLVAAYVVTQLGGHGLFQCLTVVLAAFVVFTLIQLQLRPKAPRELHSEFGAALHTVQSISPAFDVTTVPDAIEHDAVSVVMPVADIEPVAADAERH